MNESFIKTPEQLAIKVAVAGPEEWKSYRALRLEEITGLDAAMFGLTPEEIAKEQSRTEEEWRQDMTGDKFVVLAQDASGVVGMGASLKQSDGAWRARQGYIKPEFRKGKVGKKLAAVGLNEIIKRGGKKATALIKFDNKDSLYLAESMGFKKTSEFPAELKKFESNFYFLELDLTDPETVKKIAEILDNEQLNPEKPTPEQAPLGSLENPIIDSNMTREEALRPNPEFQIPQEIFERQAVITVKYLSFDGKYHQGQIVMDKELEQDVKDFFAFLIEQKFPVHKVIPIAHEDYNFSDAKSMTDNNTSGFNPRYKVGLVNASAETELSEHAKGRAFDLNPLINPYFGGPGKIPVTPIHPEDKEGERDPSEYVDPEDNEDNEDDEEGEKAEVFEYYNIGKEGTVAPWIADFLIKRGWDWGMKWYKEASPRVDTQHLEKKPDSKTI